MIKITPRDYSRGILYVSRETLFAVKLAGDELAPCLACGLGDDDCKIIAVHDGNDVGKIALESGGNGMVFLVAADDGKDGLFRSFGVHVSVQRPCVNRNTLAVLKVFDVQALCAGKLIQGFLVLCDVGNVGFDDVHIYFLSGLSIISTGRPSPADRLLSLFRHVVDFRCELVPCGFVQCSEPFPQSREHFFYLRVCTVRFKEHFKENFCTIVYRVNACVKFFKRQFYRPLHYV